MRNLFSIGVSAVALAIVVAPQVAGARDEDSIKRGDQPSVQHGVQGSHDGGMAKAPGTAPEFVKKAGQDGLAEVALGKMALTKAQDPAVKEFAQRMVDDHSKANGELKSLATAKGIQPPADVSEEQKAMADRMSKLSGAEFDKAYMQMMVGDHDDAVATFRGFAEHGDDVALKEWADKTLPTLQAHERLAKTTAAKVGVAERIGTGPNPGAGSAMASDSKPAKAGDVH